MAKKDVLLEIKLGMGDSIKKMTDLTLKVNELKKGEEALKEALKEAAESGFDKQGRSVEELTGQLIQNQQQQKAIREQMSATTREIQNTIKSEQVYANTLKGKAAQLANEKKTLREIELGQGKLSEAYIRQRKVVSDLNAEVTRLEREYGDHQRNVGNYESALNGMFGRLKLGWVAFVALIGKGLKTLAEDFKNGTQAIGDRWKIEVAGWQTAYQQLIVSMTRGDGFRELIANMKNAYVEGKRLAALMDELFERENSLKIEAADIAAEIEKEKIATRDVTRTNEERIKSAERVIELEEQLATRRKEIAQQELDIRRQQITTITRMTEAELESFVNRYNQNRQAIKEAQEYVAAYNDLQGQIASETQVRNYKRREELQGQLDALNASLSQEAAAFVEIVRKYSLANDEMVQQYVDAYTKYQQVDADLFKLTSRTQVQRSALIKQMMKEGEQAAAVQTQATANTIQDQKAQDSALKEQEKALMAYVATVINIYTDLNNARLSQTELQTQAIKEQLREQTQALAEQVKSGMMSWEEYMYYRVALSQKASADIAAINKEAQEQEQREYRQTIEAEARNRREQLQTDLQVAWRNAEEQFRIKKEYLEKELEIAGLTADRRAELEQQLTELIRSHTQSRMQMVMDYAGQLEQAFGAINTIASNLSQERIQEAEAENESQKVALDKRLKSGLISQRQYDEKVAKMDADLAQKKAQAAREEAQRNKELALFQAAINTASAIVKVWTDVPTMIAPVFTAMVAGVGALQMAAIASQPLPKARKGGKIEGPTHEQGGVLVETEGDERIVASAPSRAFPELLNLISYIGKHGPVPNTGYAERYIGHEDIDYDRMKEAMKEAMQELKLYLALSDLHEAENNNAIIEQLARQ